MMRFITLLLLLTTLKLYSQFKLPEFSNSPVADGTIGKGEWDNSLKLDTFFEIKPGENTAPDQHTETFIGYSETDLYILVKCHYTPDEKFTSHHCSRDNITSSDRVLVYFDTFNSNDKAYYIAANSLGEQGDGIIQNGNVINSVDFNFQSVTGRLDDGYFIEFKLPFKSITHATGSNVEWGFFLKRVNVDSGKEISVTKVDRESNNYFNNYGKIKFDNLKSSISLKVVPGLVGSFADGEFDGDIELNSTFSPTSDLVISTTINPDFSVIESDGVNLNINSKYSAYYPERRPFFIEKQSPWSSPLSIYHTRQVAEPYAGLKVAGKNGKDSYYFMGALDRELDQSRYYSEFEEGEKKDDTYYFFSNYKRSISDDIWLRPAISMRKGGKFESYNFSLDSRGNLGKNYSYRAHSVYSMSENFNGGFKKDQASILRMDYDSRNWFMIFKGKSIGDDFESDLGFIQERDLNQLYTKIEYSNDLDAESGEIGFVEIGVDLHGKYDYALENHKESGGELYLGFVIEDYLNLWTGSDITLERLEGEDLLTKRQWYSISSRYFDDITLRLNMTIGDYPWYGNVDSNGKPVKCDYFKFAPSTGYRLSKNISLDSEYVFRKMSDYYESHSAEFSIKYQFNKDFWFKNGLDFEHVEYDDGGIVTVYELTPLFTYKVGSGTSFYLGGNLNLDEDDDTFDFDRDVKLFMKFTKAFDLI